MLLLHLGALFTYFKIILLVVMEVLPLYKLGVPLVGAFKIRSLQYWYVLYALCSNSLSLASLRVETASTMLVRINSPKNSFSNSNIMISPCLG